MIPSLLSPGDINPLIGCGKFLNSPVNAVFWGVERCLWPRLLRRNYGTRAGTGIGDDSDGGCGSSSTWQWWVRQRDYVVPVDTVHGRTLVVPPTACSPGEHPADRQRTGAISSSRTFPCARRGLRRTLVKGRWYIIAAVYAVLVIFAVVWFWDQWMLVFLSVAAITAAILPIKAVSPAS